MWLVQNISFFLEYLCITDCNDFSMNEFLSPTNIHIYRNTLPPPEKKKKSCSIYPWGNCRGPQPLHLSVYCPIFSLFFLVAFMPSPATGEWEESINTNIGVLGHVKVFWIPTNSKKLLALPTTKLDWFFKFCKGNIASNYFKSSISCTWKYRLS